MSPHTEGKENKTDFLASEVGNLLLSFNGQMERGLRPRQGQNLRKENTSPKLLWSGAGAWECAGNWSG